MKGHEKNHGPASAGRVGESKERPSEGHIVFDFTGLHRPDVCDLSLILTARLQTAPTDMVWVRSLPEHTARVLQILRLDHLFRAYPEAAEEMN